MKCGITKQIVTDNKVIIHMVLDRPHIPGTLNGCHGLGRSILSVSLNQKCCYDQRMYCFRSTKSLICSVDYDVHPDSGCADIWFRLNTQLQCKGFSNWILAFIDTRAEPPPAIAPPPQWAAPSCNGLRAPT